MSLYFNQASLGDMLMCVWRWTGRTVGAVGAKEGDRPAATGCTSRSHLLGHLVDPRGGAVTQVRTPRVPHDLLRQALERSDACRGAQGGEGRGGRQSGGIISVWRPPFRKEKCGGRESHRYFFLNQRKWDEVHFKKWRKRVRRL